MERYLQSLGLEDTRAHLEKMCQANKPPEGGGAIGKATQENAKIIKLKDRLGKIPGRSENRSCGKTGSNATEPIYVLPNS